MLRRCLATLAGLAAALPALADPATDTAAIRARLADWTAAFNARDAAGACDLFAPDLRYALPEELDGTRATMCGNLAEVLAREDLVLHYDPPAIHEILLSGDMAAVRLTWTLTAAVDGSTETTTEEGLDVFRRQPDGRWSIARFVAFATTPDDPLR
jgi:ketosteroid isomerase-like protein